jgi:phosphohistidine phosphatase SixA
MNRRLIVMRHAKSSWKHPTLADHERPLNKRGRRDAPRVAQRLMKVGWKPQVALSSDSQRTRETAELMCGEWDGEPAFVFLNSLYHGGVDELVEEVSAVPSDIECVLVLGHNPGWEGAVHWLTGEETVLKTGCAALLLGAGSNWREAVHARGGWTVHDVVRPKELD